MGNNTLINSWITKKKLVSQKHERCNTNEGFYGSKSVVSSTHQKMQNIKSNSQCKILIPTKYLSYYATLWN